MMNSLLMQEILHNMKKIKARMGWVAIKIDFEKAFNRLEWGFILAILRNLGYH